MNNSTVQYFFQVRDVLDDFSEHGPNLAWELQRFVGCTDEQIEKIAALKILMKFRRWKLQRRIEQRMLTRRMWNYYAIHPMETQDFM
jgi:hypothetical protein